MHPQGFYTKLEVPTQVHTCTKICTHVHGQPQWGMLMSAGTSSLYNHHFTFILAFLHRRVSLYQLGCLAYITTILPLFFHCCTQVHPHITKVPSLVTSSAVGSQDVCMVCGFTSEKLSENYY